MTRLRLRPSSRRTRFILLCLAAALLPLGYFYYPTARGMYYRSRGRAALERFQNDLAHRWLEKSVVDIPKDPQTQFLLARSFRRLGRFDDMNRHLDLATRQGAAPERITRERRLAIAQTGRVDEVVPYLSDMLSDPGEDAAEICASYVSGFSLNFDFHAARLILDTWSKDFADDPEPYFRRGDLWFAGNEWKEAVEAYRKCLELAPEKTKARLSLAQCLLKMNRTAEAEPEFRRVVREDPQNLEAQTGLGVCLLTNDRVEESQALLANVAAKAPHLFEPRVRLGELELSRNRPREALVWLQPLADKWPEDGRLASLMAQALQEMGDRETARKYLKVIALVDESLTRLEKLTDAIRERPDDVALRYEVGILLMRFRSREDGAGWLKSLLQYDPRHAGAHEALADYYEKIDNAELARQHRHLAKVNRERRD